MVPIDTIIQDALQFLRDPAWQGAGVTVSSALSLIALRQARQPYSSRLHHRAPSGTILKNVSEFALS